jgi:hypothetical protein
MRRALLALLLVLGLAAEAHAQAGYLQLGTVSTLSPNYLPGTNQPTSLDLLGNLRVNCIIGCGGSGAINGFATSAIPSYTNGTTGALSLDLLGNLRVIDAAAGPVTPGAAAPKSVMFGGQFNSSLPTLTNGQQAAAQFDSSGRLIVNVGAGGGSGGTASNFAAAFPSQGTAIGAKNGANMVSVGADASGNLNINCAVGCAASTTAGPVTPGAAASQSNLIGVQFNTSLPTLTNGQQAAAQADSSGRQLVNVGTALPTGTNVIGQVGGTTVPVTQALVVSLTAYTSGQCLGSLETYGGAGRSGGPGSGLVQSATITDVAGQDAPVDVIVFNQQPTNSTFTDHATCTVNTADLGKVAGVIHITDCTLLGATAPGVCQAQQQALPFALGNSNTTLWAQAIVRGTPTYTGTGNVAVRLAFLQD